MKTICIIPARGGSKRFPRKNIAKLHGKPLVAYAIEAAKQSGVFTTVCVTTEDAEIQAIAKEYGADLVHERSEELASDTTRLTTLCVSLLEELKAKGDEYDALALVLPTNPLRTAQDIAAGYELFTEKDANYVMSVMPWEHAPQQAVTIESGFVEPFFDMSHMKTTQPETLYRDDGSFIFVKTPVFMEVQEWYGPGVVPYVMPEGHTVDIDNPRDLQWAEFLLSQEG